MVCIYRSTKCGFRTFPWRSGSRPGETPRLNPTQGTSYSAHGGRSGFRRDPHRERTISMSTKNYSVEGMTCEHCVASVQEEVAEVAGTQGVEVELESGRLVVTGEGF